jgi:hypothetical protein
LKHAQTCLGGASPIKLSQIRKKVTVAWLVGAHGNIANHFVATPEDKFA